MSQAAKSIEEEILQKCGLKLTLLQIQGAQESAIVNGCLVLKKEEYETLLFENRNDFVAVVALKLKKVPANMFNRAKNLKTVVMPEAVEILDGQLEVEEFEDFDDTEDSYEDEITNESQDTGGAFALTAVTKCFFPKLRRVGTFAFLKCPLTSLNEENFPVLQEVGNFGFYGCPIKQLNLPRLEQVGNSSFAGIHIASANLPGLIQIGVQGFSKCKLLKQFSAPKLEEVSQNCFSNCPLLQSISCDLEPDRFTCQFYNEYGEEHKCGQCPVCYQDVEMCLQRGKSGQFVEDVEIDEKKIDGVLDKFHVGITVQHAINADEGQIINECLILKEQRYPAKAYQHRSDFKSVIALRLRFVPEHMFCGVKTLETAIIPEVVGIMSDGFIEAGLQNCFSPKLVTVGDCAFYKCQMKELNFPLVESIGICGFHSCPISLISLPNLLSIGAEGFHNCKMLRQFQAQKLQTIGKHCFANCIQLSYINCDLQPYIFSCWGCGKCIICKRKLVEGLKKGKVLGQLEKAKQIQRYLLNNMTNLNKNNQIQKEQISNDSQKFFQQKIILQLEE